MYSEFYGFWKRHFKDLDLSNVVLHLKIVFFSLKLNYKQVLII